MPCGCALAASLGLALPLLAGQPRIVEFERVDWHSTSPAYTQSLSGTIATSSDGSRMNHVRYTDRRLLLFVAEKGAQQTIYARGPHTAYIVDNDKRVVTVIPCMCDWERNPWPVDTDCSRAAKEYDPDLIRTGWIALPACPQFASGR
jgi:hypothetical protein